MVKDMTEAVNFYCNVLELPLKAQHGEHYAEIDAGNMNIGLHPSQSVAPSPSVQLGIAVENFDEEVTRLESHGLKVKVQNDSWSRLATFKDADGHVIYLAESKNI